MKKFVDACIERPVSVAMFTIAIAIFGLVSFTRLPLSLLPDISYPTLTIETEYPGAAPAEIEALITRPIEESVGVISGVQSLTSRSRAGISEVTLEFLWKTNMDFAALDVREKLDLVQLPRDADNPTLLRFDPSSDPILRLGLSGSTDLAFLRQFAEEDLKKDLDSIDGVAAVKIEGGLEREIRVDIDEGKLAVFGITVEKVSDALAASNINLAGGSIYEDEARYLVRTLNEFQNIDDVASTLVLDDGERRIYLRDVAEVGWGHKERQAITKMDGSESVELRVYKEGDANTVQVARRVKARIDQLDKDLSTAGTELAILFDQSTFIEGSIDEVVSNGWQGGLLAILVIALFLRDRRATSVIGLSIPVSVVATFFVMYQMGLSLNIMSLGGLALGIGMVLDDSIVVLESIYRHRSLGKSSREAASTGAGEVGMAVVASTLTTVAVFLPIVFVQGIASQLFKDQALTVSISILASLAFSLALIPVLAARLKENGATNEESPAPVPTSRLRKILYGGPSWVLNKLRWATHALFLALSTLTYPFTWTFDRFENSVYRIYPKMIRAALAHRAAVLLAAGGLFAASLFVAQSVGIELIPNMAQGEFYFDIELPEGAPLELTDEVLTEIGREASDLPGVAMHFTSAGAVDNSGQEATGKGENRGRIHLVMANKEDRRTEAIAVAQMRERLTRYPGLAFQFDRPSYFSFKRPIELEIYGDHPQTLARYASLIAEAMESIEGLTDVRSSAEPGNPELQIFFSPERLAQMGLSVDQVSQTLRTKLRGDVATRLNEGERQIDIVVRAHEDSRARTEQVSELIVHGTGQRPVPLKAVAQTEMAVGPSEIRRVGQRRAVVISGNLIGRDLGRATRDIESAIAGLGLPASIVTRFGGQHREMESSFGSLYLAIFLAIFLVYFVMASKFESLMHPFIILFTIPLGLVGVIWALVLSGNPVSVIVLIGTVMLAGIVVKNAIVMVDYINICRERGMPKNDAIVEAGKIRLRPILMTTLTTILGLVPMALGFGEGAEIRAPMAITVIGGLAVSTLLTLIVIPTVYSMLDRKRYAGEAA